MPLASARSFAGIAKETVFGTAVAATAFIPVTDIKPKDKLTLLDDKGYRGSMVDVYDKISGPIWAELDMSGDVFPDTIGWLATGILGDLATTGASAPFTHTAAVLNTGTGQPPSYTVTDYYGSTGARQYAGFKVSELGFKFSGDGLLQYSAKGLALASATAAAPVPSFTAVTPMAGWTGAVQIAGVSSTLLMDGEFTIKRPVTALSTADGTQAPYALWSGPVAVSGKMTLVMEDDAQLTNYLTNAKPALDFNFAQGAGSSAVQVKLHASKCAYSDAEISRGKDYIELSVSYEGLANTTDVGASGGYSPCKVTIQNAIAAGTYK
ncbi:phage tail tube protein [Kitasatospora cineracea]|uniref:phage tail tube protein n=1 Tax=Kitasatospora cineracea TaxID=88074 RepID=UPI00379F3684